MSTSRSLTAAAVMALVAFGTATASPAKALVPPADGMYSFSEPGVPAATWKVYALASGVPEC